MDPSHPYVGAQKVLSCNLQKTQWNLSPRLPNQVSATWLCLTYDKHSGFSSQSVAGDDPHRGSSKNGDPRAHLGRLTSEPFFLRRTGSAVPSSRNSSQKHEGKQPQVPFPISRVCCSEEVFMLHQESLFSKCWFVSLQYGLTYIFSQKLSNPHSNMGILFWNMAWEGFPFFFLIL